MKICSTASSSEYDNVPIANWTTALLLASSSISFCCPLNISIPTTVALYSAITKSSSLNSSPNLAKSRAPNLSLFPSIGTIVDIFSSIGHSPASLKTQVPFDFEFATVSVTSKILSLYSTGNLLSDKTYVFIISHSKSLQNVCPKTLPYFSSI